MNKNGDKYDGRIEVQKSRKEEEDVELTSHRIAKGAHFNVRKKVLNSQLDGSRNTGKQQEVRHIRIRFRTQWRNRQRSRGSKGTQK